MIEVYPVEFTRQAMTYHRTETSSSTAIGCKLSQFLKEETEKKFLSAFPIILLSLLWVSLVLSRGSGTEDGYFVGPRG